MRSQAALILAAGLVVATLVAGTSAVNIANSRSTLTVTGSARRTVRADYAVWRGAFSAQAPLVEETYGELEGQARRQHGARMGVFQVTPALSTEVTDSGVNDTSSLDKDITSVVALTFEVR